jgi:hypothetical protein
VADDVRAALEHVRRIALALPEATERLSHGSPTFFVRDKPSFAMFLNDSSRRRPPRAVVCCAPWGAGGVDER